MARSESNDSLVVLQFQAKHQAFSGKRRWFGLVDQKKTEKLMDLRFFREKKSVCQSNIFMGLYREQYNYFRGFIGTRIMLM